MIRQLTFTLLFLFIATAGWAGWIKRADLEGGARHRGTGCAVGNKGYFGLGHYNGTGVNIVLKDWWEYDPATNSWSQKADYIGGNINGNYGVLTLGIGEYAYVTGGAFNDPNTHRYNPKTNIWETVASTPQNFTNIEGFVVSGKGYVLYGSNFYEFDPSTNTWNYLGNAPLNSSAWMGAFSTEEKGYVRTNSSFYEYKPSTNQWVMRAPFPGIATGASMNFTQRGKLYVVGGYGGSLSNVTREVWSYDPFLNVWEMLEEFPGTSRRFGSTFSIGDRSYVGIGTNGTNFADLWEFDAELYLSAEYLDFKDVSLYPNPAVDHINIRLETTPNFEVSIMNSQGQQVRTIVSSNGAAYIERKNLPAGIYFAQIRVNEHYLGTKKFIFK
jgi:N-acetylneuraminic acid mutarotase